MFQLISARADARSLVCALTVGLLSAASLGASSQAQAETTALMAVPARAAVSDVVLRSAVARTDLSPLGLLTRSTPIPVQAAPVRTAVTGSSSAPANGRELDCMAQAVYFEARGEPMLGQLGVAQVVMNRVRHPAFPKSVCGVVFQRAGHSCQFSWACHRPSGPSNAGQWAQARAVAGRVMAGEVVASLSFATHFNGARARGFGSGLQRVAQIGQHAFYRFNGAKGSPSMFGASVHIAQAQTAAAPRVYASLLPLPSKAAADKLLASATAAAYQVANVAQSAVGAAAQTFAGQGATTAQPGQAVAETATPLPTAAPSAVERTTALAEQTATAAG